MDIALKGIHVPVSAPYNRKRNTEVFLARPCVCYFSLLPNISSRVSTRNLNLIAVDRFGAVVLPLARKLVNHLKKTGL